MHMNDPITKSVSNAYKKMKAEELTDKQKKHIDKNNNNKIDSHDFKLLRKEEDEVEEGWDDKVNEVTIPINMLDADMEHAVRANIPADIQAKDKEAFTSFAIQFFKFY